MHAARVSGCASLLTLTMIMTRPYHPICCHHLPESPAMYDNLNVQPIVMDVTLTASLRADLSRDSHTTCTSEALPLFLSPNIW